MTKEVLISISGLQTPDANDGETIEIITPGNYYKKGGRHYVMYEEVAEGQSEITKNLLKFDESYVAVTKRGYVNVDMVFEKNKRNMTNYITQFGSILVGIDADSIEISEEEDSIKLNIDYKLDLNYQHFADCRIRMEIQSKSSASLDLFS